MEPSKDDYRADEKLSQLGDDTLRIERRVLELEKQMEFCFTLFNLVVLAALLYFTYPYIFPQGGEKDIPGVKT